MSYGQLLSSKLLTEGKFVEALAAATREVDQQPDEPETYFNRGQALVGLNQTGDAIADYEKALSLDGSNSTLDPETVDDELFFALRTLADAQSADPAQAIATLRRYVAILPAGRHVDDIAKWADKFNGVETVWYRDRI